VALSRRTTGNAKPTVAPAAAAEEAVPVPAATAASARRASGAQAPPRSTPSVPAQSARPPKRKSPSGRRNEQLPEKNAHEAAPTPRRGGREGDSIGSLRRRGWSLAVKFSVFTLLVSVLITMLFGVFSIRDLRTHMLDEIIRSGYQDVLVLNAFGQHVVRDLAGKRDAEFSSLLNKYRDNNNPDYKKDRDYLRRIKSGDPRIQDVAIFGSGAASNDPASPIVRASDDATSFTHGTAQPVSFDDKDVSVFWVEYGGKSCLLFRLPLERAGHDSDKMYSSANIILSASAIDEEVGKLTTKLVLVGLLFVGAGVGLSMAMGFRITQPINGLVEDINIVSQGDLDHESNVQNETQDEIGLLAMAFNRMTKNLRDAREKERDSERIASELNTAQAIHAKLMPDKLPNLPGLDISTAYHCAKEVGGDYYDFIPVGDAEHLAFVVADVAGKGIPGSMVMGQMRTVLRMMAVNNMSAADVLSKTNFHVARDIKRGMFVTCMYAILNLRTRDMTIASAGHNPMLIWRAATQTIEKVRPNGIALGFDKGPVFNRTVREQKLRLLHGDRVVLYTDGVVEAMNENRDEWGDEALDAFTLKYATAPSNEYVRLLVKALEDHKGRAEQHDDITITTFRVS
jgi:serine phosphatase RsbU (regulator of sigma subunit)